MLTSATLRAVPGVSSSLWSEGVGKSTLLKIAAGWISPDSGTNHFDGRAYLSVGLADLAEAGLFYLPDHDLLSPAFTIRRQLEMIRLQFDGSEEEYLVGARGVFGRELDVDMRAGERDRIRHSNDDFRSR